MVRFQPKLKNMSETDIVEYIQIFSPQNLSKVDKNTSNKTLMCVWTKRLNVFVVKCNYGHKRTNKRKSL